MQPLLFHVVLIDGFEPLARGIAGKVHLQLVMQVNTGTASWLI
jgi:hypothetical protein